MGVTSIWPWTASTMAAAAKGIRHAPVRRIRARAERAMPTHAERPRSRMSVESGVAMGASIHADRSVGAAAVKRRNQRSERGEGVGSGWDEVARAGSESLDDDAKSAAPERPAHRRK